MIVFQKKQISAILGCTMLLSIILLNLTGCGGGGGNDDPVVYRLDKYDTYLISPEDYSGSIITYEKSGNPVQIVSTDEGTMIVTPAIDKGKLVSLKHESSSSEYALTKYIYNSAGQLETYEYYDSNTDHPWLRVTIEYTTSGNKDKCTLQDIDDFDGSIDNTRYSRFVYTGEKIKQINYYSDPDCSLQTSYTDVQYDSNGNISQTIDYGSGGVKKSYSEFTWEKGKCQRSIEIQHFGQ
jgi:hypothetical protein